MPYEYRKMTPEERLAVVNTRKSMGYPHHGPPHIAHGAGYFLISAAYYEHNPIMVSPDRRTKFEARIRNLANENDFDLHAWVILPNHYHILNYARDRKNIPPFMKRLHNGSSYEWNHEDGCVGKRKVWYQYFDRFIDSETHYYQALNYIHYNPVKHGLVEDPYAWEWSSLGLYLEAEGRDWLRSTWSKYPPEKLGFDLFD
jgi:putative transposase